MLKALGVDFIKYPLSAIIEYVQWSRTGQIVKQAVNLSETFFRH